MSAAGSSLSSAEVAALMEGLSDVEPDAPAPGDVRPFALGQEALRSTTRLAGLDRISERLARRLRTVVEPFARAKTQVIPERTETRRFEDWRAELPEFTSLSLYRLRPARGGLLVVLEPGFIANMVDAVSARPRRQVSLRQARSGLSSASTTRSSRCWWRCGASCCRCRRCWRRARPTPLMPALSGPKRSSSSSASP
jgi:hypothetical protein